MWIKVEQNIILRSLMNKSLLRKRNFENKIFMKNGLILRMEINFGILRSTEKNTYICQKMWHITQPGFSFSKNNRNEICNICDKSVTYFTPCLVFLLITWTCNCQPRNDWKEKEATQNKVLVGTAQKAKIAFHFWQNKDKL